jgi:hypothetical protein
MEWCNVHDSGLIWNGEHDSNLIWDTDCCVFPHLLAKRKPRKAIILRHDLGQIINVLSQEQMLAALTIQPVRPYGPLPTLSI